MKKIILLTLCLIVLSPMLFAGDYNFNQNYNVGKYITDGTWTYFAAESYNRVEMKMTKEETGLTDADGNKSYKLHFVSEEHDFYLVPDNPFYPLFYRLMVADKNEKNLGYRLKASGGSGMSDNGYIVLNENHLACITVYSGDTRPTNDDEVNHTRIGVSVQNFDELMQRLEPKTYCSAFSFVRGKATGTPYKGWVEFKTAQKIEHFYGAGQGTPITQYPGIPAYYEHLKAFLDKNMEDAKAKKVNGLLDEFEDGDYIFYVEEQYHKVSDVGGAQDGKVRLKFQKQDGKVTGINIQNCFTDGVFYDKEKFFVNWVVGNDGSVSGQDFKLMPFAGRLIVINLYNGGFNSVWGIFSKDATDTFAEFMTHDKFWSVDETDHAYFCKAEFETEYGNVPDHYRMSVYMNKYYATLTGK